MGNAATPLTAAALPPRNPTCPTALVSRAVERARSLGVPLARALLERGELAVELGHELLAVRALTLLLGGVVADDVALPACAVTAL
jgi:hypothetical protein